MIQSNFREWTLDKIDEAFGVKQIFKMALLDELVSYPYEVDAFEERYILGLQAHFHLGGDDWNEVYSCEKDLPICKGF
jgi:hypothetical protein